jgi:hypothetical protein
MVQETLTVGALPPVRVQLHSDVQLMVAHTSHDTGEDSFIPAAADLTVGSPRRQIDDVLRVAGPGDVEAAAVSAGHSRLACWSRRLRLGQERVRSSESVNLYEAPLRGFYRVVASVFWGGLIQVLAGISGGSGGLLTKRSGWAA